MLGPDTSQGRQRQRHWYVGNGNLLSLNWAHCAPPPECHGHTNAVTCLTAPAGSLSSSLFLSMSACDVWRTPAAGRSTSVGFGWEGRTPCVAFPWRLRVLPSSRLLHREPQVDPNHMFGWPAWLCTGFREYQETRAPHDSLSPTQQGGCLVLWQSGVEWVQGQHCPGLVR